MRSFSDLAMILLGLTSGDIETMLGARGNPEAISGLVVPKSIETKECRGNLNVHESKGETATAARSAIEFGIASESAVRR